MDKESSVKYFSSVLDLADISSLELVAVYSPHSGSSFSTGWKYQINTSIEIRSSEGMYTQYYVDPFIHEKDIKELPSKENTYWSRNGHRLFVRDNKDRSVVVNGPPIIFKGID